MVAISEMSACDWLPLDMETIVEEVTDAYPALNQLQEAIYRVL